MQNEQFSKEQIQMVGNYAAYLHNIGEAIGKFASIDVLTLARAALAVQEMEQAVKMANDQTERTRDAMQKENEALHSVIRENGNIIDEMRGDVRNAEAHSDDLDSQLQAATIRCKEVEEQRNSYRDIAQTRYNLLESIYALFGVSEDLSDDEAIKHVKSKHADLKLRGDNQSAACQFWYDAWNDVRSALDVDTEGLADDEKVSAVVEAAKRSISKIPLVDSVMRVLDALQLSHDLNLEQVVAHAQQIRHAADAHAAQENEWQRRYNELCNTVGIESTTHDAALIEARDLKAAVDRGDKQENYQRKYNELKGSLGLAGMPHDEALKMARQDPIR